MMNNTLPSAVSDRNPVTHKAHSRQVLWQITVPIIVGAILVIAVAVLASLSGPDTASRWADISLIFLILPLMLVTLLFLLIGAAMVYGLLRLLKVLPTYTRKAQDLAFQLEQRARSFADSAAKPVIRANSISAGWRRFWGR